MLVLQVDVFVDKMGEHRPFIQATAVAATMFSITSAVLDGTIGLILGYAGLAYTTNRAGCEVIVVTNLCVATMIAAYVITNGGTEDDDRLLAENSSVVSGSRKEESKKVK